LSEIVRPRRFGDEETLKLASHLTERDRNIAKDCFEFRVLTPSQITRLHFTDLGQHPLAWTSCIAFVYLIASVPRCRWEMARLPTIGFSMREVR
jgi:hypothetical protein